METEKLILDLFKLCMERKINFHYVPDFSYVSIEKTTYGLYKLKDCTIRTNAENTNAKLNQLINLLKQHENKN